MNTKNDSGKHETADGELPSREQLSAMAAATQRTDPADAVNHALAVWHEAGKRLDAEREAKKWRGYEHRLPPKFPATRAEFERLIVRAKTPSDCTKRLRDFLKAETQETIMAKRLKGDDGRGTWTAEERADIDKEAQAIAESRLKALHDGGFSHKEAWLRTARQYSTWHRQQKSETSRKNAMKRVNGGKTALVAQKSL